MNEQVEFNETRCEDQEGYLRLVDLSKSYFDGKTLRVVLKETCFQFQKGEFAAILGRSGSGKTTLLNLISGIDRADSGKVILDQTDLTALSEEDRTLVRRSRIGFIFQFFNLIPTLTVWENITLPLELNRVMDDTRQGYARDLLDSVGLVDRAGHYPDQLSGGEQQRVSIARALVHDPQVILADEPTGNLDEETGHVVLQLLDRLVAQTGKNLIMVTHSPAAAAYADRVLVLKEGRLTEDGRGRQVDL